MLPKIYISQYKDVSYDDAKRFANDLIFLTNKEWRTTNPVEENLKITNNIVLDFHGYDARNDYVILNGNPIIMGFVFNLAMKQLDTIKLLKWSNSQLKYDVVIFDPYNLKLIPEDINYGNH